MRQSLHSLRGAFTLAEFLVVLGIIALILGIAVPAVVQVQEASHRVSCSNHLHQIGLALHQHQTEHGVLPSNGGWDRKQFIQDVNGKPVFVFTHDTILGVSWHWGVGDPTLGPREQTGSWAYSILPFIEQQTVYRERAWQTAIKLYHCPSRRAAEAQEAKPDQYGFYSGGGWKWGKTDYAGNMRVIQQRPFCKRMGDLRDGAAYTILAGEKAMHPDNYHTGTWYWDEPFFTGGSDSTARKGLEIIQDADTGGFKFRQNWGSPHPRGANFLFGDGSVRPLAHGLRADKVLALLTPDGGETLAGEF